MREKIDLSSDISLLLAQLRRLAASRLGRRLGLGLLILTKPATGTAISRIKMGIKIWGEELAEKESIDYEGFLEFWEMLETTAIRNEAIRELKSMSESVRIFAASEGEEKRGEEWGSSDEDEEL